MFKNLNFENFVLAIFVCISALGSASPGAVFPPKSFLTDGDMVRWSPDGTKIVYLKDTTYSNKGRPNVFVADPDGTDSVQITYFRGNESSGQYGSAYGPTFRPGTNRVYWRDDIDGAWYASYALADGSGSRTRTQLGGAYQPLRFNEDGSKYATAFAFNQYRSIYSGEGDPPWNAGTTVRIIEGVNSTIEWGYGDKANKLLYSRTVGGSSAIYLLNNSVPPANETLLVGAEADQASWAPDGESIFFRRFLSGRHDIWSLNLETSELLQRTNTIEEERFPSLSPDGKTLIFSVYDAAGSLTGDREIYQIFATDLTAIPEPSSLGLLVALAMTCAARRRTVVPSSRRNIAREII